MSLFGALFTGVSGMGAQSQSTSMIANNIANVNTVGFKRSEASFYSLVTNSSRSSLYSPGTVSVNRVQRVDLQGAIQQTGSSTDAAVSGNGFFTVKRSTDDGQEFLYTRSGSFSEDKQGLLRNTAGFVLYGWPLAADGSLPSNQGDLKSLQPVDVAFLGGLTRPTSTADISLNLDASEVDHTIDNVTNDLTPSDFTRGLTVYDTLGQAQVLTFEFSKSYGPHATAGGSVSNLLATDNLVSDLGLNDGDQFHINVDGALARTYDIQTAGTGDIAVTTINDIIDDINTNVAGVSAFLGNDGELVVQRDDFQTGAETIELANDIGTPLTGLGLPTGVINSDDMATDPSLSGRTNGLDNGDPTDSPPYSNSGLSDANTFPAFRNLPGDTSYNNRGWWQMNIIKPDGTSFSRGMINFNSDGSINALPDSSGNVDINLSQIDWGNGSEPQNIDIDISKFSQFSGNYDVISSDQNGAELGLRTGVEITREGVVVAQFSNGATADLYKVPLVTFANPNGLTEVSGTAYSKNQESGEDNLREAGQGGAGFLEPSTVESSNVDLADEFAKLIVAQRAFSANTRVITTVDQMTQDLLQVR